MAMALIQCPECKKDFSDTATSCPHCGFIGEPGSVNYQRHHLQQMQGLQNPPMSAAEMAKLQRFGFPAFLSFLIPGLGQLVKGNVLRGIAFFGVCIVIGIGASVAVPGFGFLIAGGLWVWNIWDAYTPG